MSIDMPAALEHAACAPRFEVVGRRSTWAETALTVLFAAVAVLFASFIAVVSGAV
jgi:hypothetical protein